MKRAVVEIGWKSIPGQRHRAEGRENEDAVVVLTEHPCLDAVLVVADGMGGHALPQLAAQTAAERARDFLCEDPRIAEGPALPRLLSDAVHQADASVRELAARGSNGKDPGTTLTVAVVADGTLHVAHVGDGSVFLGREGSVRRLAGGEERRLGNRPENYLGSGGALEVEATSVPVRPGDRILICTDGLTRYFTGETGLRGIAGILGRRAAGAQAIASQLTAHSRSDDYDDDTSVVVAEVNELREIRTGRAYAELPEARAGLPWAAILGAALLGAALLGTGFLIGRAARPESDAAPEVTRRAPAAAELAPVEDLGGLPRGNVVLVDELKGQVYLLRTAPPSDASGPGPGALRALRLKGRKFENLAGNFRLDAARRLTAPDGRVYPLAGDPETGALLIRRAATLVIRTRQAGAECWLDGRLIGKTPLQLTVAAGSHTLRVDDPQGPVIRPVSLLPNETLSLNFDPR